MELYDDAYYRNINRLESLLARHWPEVTRHLKLTSVTLLELICYLGYYQPGINGEELARYFGISRPSVSKAIKRGEKFAKEDDVKLLS